MNNYRVEVRQTGDVFKGFISFGEAEKTIEGYEQDDLVEGRFEENYYQISRKEIEDGVENWVRVNEYDQSDEEINDFNEVMSSLKK